MINAPSLYLGIHIMKIGSDLSKLMYKCTMVMIVIYVL